MITEQMAASTLPPHVFRRLNFDSECWLFTGPLRKDGYARVSVGDKMVYLHVFVWERFNGRKPYGFELDHLTCRNRSCCNPGHLEAVSKTVNISRGETGKNSYSKTHCPQNHPYDQANTYVTKEGKRVCRSCNRDRQRKYKAGRR